MNEREEVRKKVEEIVEPVLELLGMELVDVEYNLEPRGWVLRIYIDKEGGVTIDDCVFASEELGRVLDVEDPIPHSYNLEVSSPGIERPLRRERDFLRFKGRKVKVRLKEKISGRRNFKGTILGYEDGNLVIEVEGSGVFRLPKGSIDRAKLVWEEW